MAKGYKIAELLLRRKELAIKLQAVTNLKAQVSNIFEQRVKRVKVTDSIDEVVADVPKLELKQFTAELDFYNRQFRQLDALIQQANWQTEVETDFNLFGDFKSE